MIMEYKELNQLLSQRQKLLNADIKEEHFNKLKGEPIEAGSRCEIIWNDWGEDYPDAGYLFDLPIDNSSDEGDVFVHIPNPQNPSGIGTPPSVFLHLYDLMSNNQVKNIIILENKK